MSKVGVGSLQMLGGPKPPMVEPLPPFTIRYISIFQFIKTITQVTLDEINKKCSNSIHMNIITVGHWMSKNMIQTVYKTLLRAVV